MFRRHTALGIYLILAALFAHAAQAAETILVDPGPVGESAQALSFSVPVPSTAQVDLVFSDNKTLTFGPGDQKFSLAFLSGLGFFYDGVLLDEFGEEIPGTAFAGIANVTEPDLRLAASTVWSGMRFNGEFFGGSYQLVWIPGPVPLPVVGDTTGNNLPRADAGGPYSGVLFAPLTFDGSASVDTDGEIVAYNWNFGDETSGTGVNPIHTYTFTANSYLVTLTVTDDTGAVSTANTTADIGSASAPPDADAGGPYIGTAGAAVAFDGTGSTDPDGTIDSYFWTFGDQSVDSGPTPTHTYTADGKYLVTLTVNDDTGEEEQAATVAAIGIGTGNLPPSADAGPPVTGVVGVAVSFDGSASSDPDGTIAQYDWDFGDENTGTSPNPTISYTYDTPGLYTVTLTVTDDGGTRTSSVTTADIAQNNQPPVADANGPYSDDVGVAVDFDGSGSSDPDGTIVTYAWDFGDSETGVGATVSHTYAVAGDYDVVLTVIDEDGGIGEDKTTATIGSDNQPPVADANGPYAGIVDAAVSFDGTASDDPDGDIATYAWDFGDNIRGSGAQPQHTYLETGVYDVTLTVTDNNGGTDVSVTQAIIGDGNLPPVADTGGPYRGQIGIPVTFDGSASSDRDGTITTYEWDFGDETNGGSVTINHTYTAAGFYHVTLTVTDDDGAANSTSTLVEIGTTSVPPLADAGGPYTSTPGTVINFDGTGSSDTDGTIVSWAWDFGDESSGDGATTQKAYTAPGTYFVTLTVTDITGETDIDLTTALVADGNLPPEADAGGPYGGAVGAIVSFDGTGSSDANGNIASYTWDFGDETTATGPTATHAYSEAGSYRVTLTVTDDEGLPASNGTLANIGPLDLSGTVTDTGGTPLCSLVLASGQFMFSCNPNGPFSLTDLPREADGSVKRQVYVDGFFPNIKTLQASVSETVVMTRAGTCPDYNTFPDPGVFPESAGKRIDVSGTVLLQNSTTPVCAMVLANGQFDFTCDGTGSYAGNIPLDANGQYKLQVYAQGFAPLTQRFDEFSPTNEVRLARATECQ